jgi:hypothetical protein
LDDQPDQKKEDGRAGGLRSIWIDIDEYLFNIKSCYECSKLNYDESRLDFIRVEIN